MSEPRYSAKRIKASVSSGSALPRAGHSTRLPGQILALVLWLATCFATGALGAVASINAASVYGALTQPA